MSLESLALYDFRPARSKHMTSQRDILAWDAWRRARSLRALGEVATDEAEEALRQEILETWMKISDGRIEARGHETSDFRHRETGRMEIYHDRHPGGATLHERMDFAGKAMRDIFENRFYPEGSGEAPDAILFISHAAFIVPSAAQRLVMARNWGERTRVYNLYASGCLASLQALRIASGVGPTASRARGWRVDVAVAELNTLQGLLSEVPWNGLTSSFTLGYGDGLVRFSVTDDPRGAPHLRVLASKEVIISTPEETTGFALTENRALLSQDPGYLFRVGRALKPLVRKAFAEAGLDFEAEKRGLALASYLGPPNLTDVVPNMLELEPAQSRHAVAVTREMGSSGTATIPIILGRILADPDVPSGARVLVVGAGAGLNLSVCVLEKRA